MHIPLVPLRLMRSFRSGIEPIPYFLQDLLAEAPCSSCPEHSSRLLDLLKNIQFHSNIDSGAEGRLWFEIRSLLKSRVLADNHIFADGRAVRDYLLSHLKPKCPQTFCMPEGPVSPMSFGSPRNKIEGLPPFLGIARPRELSLGRQTTQ